MIYKDLVQTTAVEFSLRLMGLARNELVGSRYFKTEREYSDFDFLIEPNNSFLKVLSELEKEGKLFRLTITLILTICCVMLSTFLM